MNGCKEGGLGQRCRPPTRDADVMLGNACNRRAPSHTHLAVQAVGRKRLGRLVRGGHARQQRAHVRLVHRLEHRRRVRHLHRGGGVGGQLPSGRLHERLHFLEVAGQGGDDGGRLVARRVPLLQLASEGVQVNAGRLRLFGMGVEGRQVGARGDAGGALGNWGVLSQAGRYQHAQAYSARSPA